MITEPQPRRQQSKSESEALLKEARRVVRESKKLAKERRTQVKQVKRLVRRARQNLREFVESKKQRE